jgi:hypothetical protein
LEEATRVSGLEEIHHDATMPFNSTLFEEEEKGKRTAALMNAEEETNQPCFCWKNWTTTPHRHLILLIWKVIKLRRGQLHW